MFFHDYKEMNKDIHQCEKLEDVKHEEMRQLPEYIMEKSEERSLNGIPNKDKKLKTVKINFKNSH